MQDKIFKSVKDLEDELETLNNSLNKYRETEDRIGEADTLNKIGDILIKLNRFDDALKNLRESKKVHKKLEDNSARSRDIALIGKALFRLKRYDEAIENYKKAIEIIENNDLQVQNIEYVNYYGEIGNIYSEMGEFEKALKYHKICREKYEKHKDKIFSDEFMRFQRVGNLGIADSLQNMGDMYNLMHKYKESIETYNKALKIYRDLNVVDDEADLLQKFGDLYSSMEDYEKAYISYKDAGDIHHKINDLRNFALDIEKMSEIIGNDYPDESLKLLERCTQIYDKLCNNVKLAETYRRMALVHRNNEKMDEALDLHNKALNIFQELNNKIGEGKELRSIGEIVSEVDNEDDALKYYFKSLKIFEDLKNQLEIAGTYMNIAVSYHNKRDMDKALEYIDKAIKIANELKLSNLLSQFERLKTDIISD